MPFSAFQEDCFFFFPSPCHCRFSSNYRNVKTLSISNYCKLFRTIHSKLFIIHDLFCIIHYLKVQPLSGVGAPAMFTKALQAIGGFMGVDGVSMAANVGACCPWMSLRAQLFIWRRSILVRLLGIHCLLTILK